MASSEAETLPSCPEYLPWEPVISILSGSAFLCRPLWPVRCPCHFIVKRWFGGFRGQFVEVHVSVPGVQHTVASRLSVPAHWTPCLPRGLVVPGVLTACLLLFSSCPASDGSIWSLTVSQSELQRLSVFQPCCFQCF